MDIINLLISILVGLGLSAACGFRVFLPPLIAGLFAYTGHLDLGESFQWLGEPITLIALALASAFEIAAFYIPWVSNLLDAVAAPAAVVAGTILSASIVADDMNPFFQWSFAIIAGVGVSGGIHASTAVIRGGTNVATGGMGNPLLATVEAGGATTVSVLAIVLPLILLFVALGALAILIKKWPFSRKSVAAPSPANPA